MEKERYPILEFDHSRETYINASSWVKSFNLHKFCVFSMFKNLNNFLLENGLINQIAALKTGALNIPIYEYKQNEQKVILMHPGIGAPFCVLVFEEMIIHGCKKFMVCGEAGVLVPDIEKGEMIVPTSFVRDEGNSYHYLPPSREVETPKKIINKIEGVLKSKELDYKLGKTWTTDGIFRETKNKAKLRRDEGCISVEMEASAFISASIHLGVDLGVILAAADDLSGEQWNHRKQENKIEIHNIRPYLMRASRL
ncbi:MAG: nucleoside phosphorylase [Caldisericia bacterium]